MCKNLHILKSLRKVLVFWGSLIGNLCYERLHSSCILQGEGERIFFKGAKFFHIPPTSYRCFDILFSWPKEMKKKMVNCDDNDNDDDDKETICDIIN